MGSIAEIERAITKLSPREFIELEQWFDAERNRKWDRQIEADAKAGRLDFLWAQAKSEISDRMTNMSE